MAPQPSPIRFRLALGLIALLVVPVAIIAFNWAGEDCFITYRYAENLAEGHGLVFNSTDQSREDRVEGYSNFTLTVMLAAVHRMGGSTVFASRWIAIVAASLTVILLGLLAQSMDPERRGHPAALLPAAMFALMPVIHYQIGRALEATLYTLFVVLAALLFVRRRHLAASVALGLVALSRPEGFLFAAPFAAAWIVERWFARSRGEAERSAGAQLVWLLLPWAVITVALFVWRFSYYGHWMPNSVVLKTQPGAAESSVRLVRDFIVSWSFLPVLIPLAFAGLTQAVAERRRCLIVLALLMAHQLAFILAVGDVPASPFRHFVPLIPFACLCIGAVVAAGASRLPRSAAIYAVVACLALNLYTVDNRDGSRTRLHVRLREFVVRHGGGLNSPLRQFAFHWRWFHSPPIRLDAQTGRWMRENLPPDALVAADQMGQLAYHAGQPMLDLFGLMDETIARRGLDVDHVFERNPDLMVFMYQTQREDYTPFQRPLREDPRFAERYRLRWMLPSEEDVLAYHFHIFVRRDLDDGQPAETVILPGTRAELDRRWRVLGE